MVTFKSVDEILLCNNSNENLFDSLLNSTIYFFGFYKTKFDILLFFFNFSLVFFFF